MKINLLCSEDVRNGEYINIPVGKFSPESKNGIIKHGEIESFDWLCEDNSVDEIIALNSLNYIRYEKLEQALRNWFKKLKMNGILKVSIIDLQIISKSFINCQIKLKEFQELLFGSINNPKLSSSDAISLCDLIENNIGFKIQIKRYDGILFYLEAMKT